MEAQYRAGQAGPAGSAGGDDRAADDGASRGAEVEGAHVDGNGQVRVGARVVARHHTRPLRSEGGHRRYSRYQLKIAARVRELVDQGTPVEAACRIVILEDQLDEAQRINEQLRGSPSAPRSKADA
ncbi:MerR family transcriptional regulator [Streptomyces camponoticapitis]|uniref:MerR family transcriptional regulator n=1 Tax=Streptomyces camponoticapitis TaxID=1616125 RepID=UPI0035712702